MIFYTQYLRPDEAECPLENHPDEGKVERVGYMETEKLVNTFILAGERLKMFRGAEYGPDEEIPLDAPASSFGSEMDAILAIRAVNKRLEENLKDKIMKDQEAADAAKAVAEESAEVK